MMNGRVSWLSRRRRPSLKTVTKAGREELLSWPRDGSRFHHSVRLGRSPVPRAGTAALSSETKRAFSKGLSLRPAGCERKGTRLSEGAERRQVSSLEHPGHTARVKDGGGVNRTVRKRWRNTGRKTDRDREI